MPSCPSCGKTMVLRTVRNGSRAGQQFYVCSKWQTCRGTRSVSSKSSKSVRSRNNQNKTASKVATQRTSGQHVPPVTQSSPVDPILRKKIEVAVNGWVESLVDFSRNNNLLFYKETKTTTLDLSVADSDVLSNLLSGGSVSLQGLFSNLDAIGVESEALQKDVFSRIKKIRSKAQENFEERSIGTLALARGFASWVPTGSLVEGRPPDAPVFIYSLEIRPGKRRDDLTVSLAGEPELNPVLQIFLKREYGIDTTNQSELSDEEVDSSIESKFDQFRKNWSDVPGLVIDERCAISNFSYAKLSMVQDLESGIDDLTNHPLVLALAGDVQAQDAVRNQVTDIDLGLPNKIQPVNEFLILDADSSQNEVINAIVAGQSFAFEGPPGTGKSQTIANSIATLVAQGKKVLFVAEKRAAIDAVIRRLSSVGLDELIMDFHGAGKKRREVLDELGRTLNVVRGVPVGTRDESYPNLIESRNVLLNHNAELFRVHQPWGLSLYEVLEIGSSVDGKFQCRFRFRPSQLELLTSSQVKKLEIAVSQYEKLSGFDSGLGAEMWRNSAFSSAEEVSKAINALRELGSGGLARFEQSIAQALELLGQPQSEEFSAVDIADSLIAIDEMQKRYSTKIFESEIISLSSYFETKKSAFSLAISSVFSPSFRKAVKKYRVLLDDGLTLTEIRKTLLDLRNIFDTWTSVFSSSRKVPIVSKSTVLVECVNSRRQVKKASFDLRFFEDLELSIHVNDGNAHPIISELLKFESVGRGLIECSSLRNEFNQFELEPLLAELRDKESGLRMPGEAVRYAWSQSLADYLRSISPTISVSNSDYLDATVKNFCEDDIRNIDLKPEQIKRIWARKFESTRMDHPKQEQSMLASINRKRNLPGLSRMLGQAPDVISALKPCWVMSPLSVSMLRPPSMWFDVVIFDEASQIPPADAITSIKAAKQMVVAGDSLQLPPTPFFAAGEVETEDQYENDEYVEVTNSSDYESILDFVKMIIPKYRQLRWHYRSRDEKLIAFSNYKLYKSLIAFPYAGDGKTLEHILVPVSEGAKGKGASNPSEVQIVTDLVIRHAIENPQESLGVIAPGIKHSTAIEESLNNARLLNSELDLFLSSDLNGEPFFVKNLERVQGDERDCIILSIGYGRGELGQVKYTFGPLLGAKGERRLNVATTRAKLRMTTVATFGSGDLDVTKSSKGGAAFLREYLAFVESEGTLLPDKGSTRVEMNPFEQSVHDQLVRQGVMLIPQYGVGNYRLDFAVQNPSRPGEFILAIECDGRSYHSFPTARERDRLREAALGQRGWKFHRIWSDHWFANPEAEVARALEAIRRSLG